MKKEDLIKVIREIIKEEVSILVPVAVNTLLEESVMKGVKRAIQETAALTQQPPRPSAPRKTNRSKLVELDSELEMLGEIEFPETHQIERPATKPVEHKVMSFEYEDGKNAIIDTRKVPEEVLENVFTRNYSSFMKGLKARK